MSDSTVSTCVHCGQRVVRVNFALGPSWVHQPAGAAFADGQYTYCKRTVAEPIRQGGQIVSGNKEK